MTQVDRKYSTPEIYDNSIDYDDEPDGSDGGYDRHGNFIIPSAMKELITLRFERDIMKNALDIIVQPKASWDNSTPEMELGAIKAIAEVAHSILEEHMNDTSTD